MALGGSVTSDSIFLFIDLLVKPVIVILIV